jgi:small neutral amino acid transporter SnatA (MarC family)
MSREIIDRETILDLTVNFIPLGILVFFFGLYLVVNPWGFDPVFSTIQFAIIGGIAVALTILTYVSGKAVARDEKRFGEEH